MSLDGFIAVRIVNDDPREVVAALKKTAARKARDR